VTASDEAQSQGQQLERQLPTHDQDLQKAMIYLTSSQGKQIREMEYKI
jgi:geranylgeranyl pyrophosphate synthase